MTPIPSDSAAGVSPVRRRGGARDGSRDLTGTPPPPAASPHRTAEGALTSPPLPVSGPHEAAAGRPDPVTAPLVSSRADGAARGRPSQTPAWAGSAAGGPPPAGSTFHSAAKKRAADPTHPLAAKMTEAELEEHIRALCKDLGLLRFHVRDSRGTNAGLPDDVIIGPGGVLWRECKTQKGRLTPAQWAAANALNLAGQDWDTWRPEDLLSGRIAKELTAISRLGGAA
jgi:hypothetical protein